MTKEKLESVYWLRKELRHWQERYAELQADIALSPKVLDGMPFQNTNTTSNPTEVKGIKLYECTKAINAKMVEINNTLTEIDKFLLDLQAKDSFISYILWARCENLLKWDAIAETCGEGYTADAVRQAYHRFVDTLPKE